MAEIIVGSLLVVMIGLLILVPAAGFASVLRRLR